MRKKPPTRALCSQRNRKTSLQKARYDRWDRRLGDALAFTLVAASALKLARTILRVYGRRRR